MTVKEFLLTDNETKLACMALAYLDEALKLKAPGITKAFFDEDLNPKDISDLVRVFCDEEKCE